MIPAFGRQRQEFDASQFYKASPRTARAITEKPCLGKLKRKKKKEEKKDRVRFVCVLSSTRPGTEHLYEWLTHSSSITPEGLSFLSQKTPVGRDAGCALSLTCKSKTFFFPVL